MRLINCSTLQMKEFFEDELPRYAILSHTWGEEEVSYLDFRNESLREGKRGFKKIKEFCARAAESQYEWAWIDTCCIDKTSSSDLSEAINSMFRWYHMSDSCFAYLSDVDGPSVVEDESSDFRTSRWFRRGWTLQELLAPRRVLFYNKSWSRVGSRGSLCQIICEITNIPVEILEESFSEDVQYTLRRVPFAQRISWASNRQTSRKEDGAYCLLGLLNINMPLLYGEGDRAFVRLQEEFIRSTYDHTVLAWGFGIPYSHLPEVRVLSGSLRLPPVSLSCLTHSPLAFAEWNEDISTITRGNHYLQTNLGIYIELPIISLTENGRNYGLALLDCGVMDKESPEIMALPLELARREGSTILAYRAQGIVPFLTPTQNNWSVYKLPVYLSSTRSYVRNFDSEFSAKIYLGHLLKIGYYIADFFPPCIAFLHSDTLAILDEVNCRRLFRFCHPNCKTILLIIEPISPDSPDQSFEVAEMKIAITTSNFSSWQHILQPRFEKIDFDQLHKSLAWVPKGYLKRNKRRSRPPGPVFTSIRGWQYCGWQGSIKFNDLEIEDLRR
ncbi:HET-domain-containing protein [Hypoxylon sp. NC0597]|nr:HET-domain-containing protein [Hypoxylon sp. NC0597]